MTTLAVAVVSSLALHAAHVISVPILVTFDGQWYVHLANVLGTANFWSQWDFLRTPLFPLTLRVFFWLFGSEALAVIALQTLLGCVGIWVVSGTLWRIGHRIQASILVVFLSACPTLVAYEHAVLTEIGTFCFIAILIGLLADVAGRPVTRAGGIIAAISAGFYYRASILYLAPIAALLFAVAVLRPKTVGTGSGLPPERPGLWVLVCQTAAVAIVPFLLAWPWLRIPAAASRTGQSVLLYGLIKQAVIPPTDPIWAGKPGYAEALQRSQVAGRLPVSGLRGGSEYEPLSELASYGSVASSVFGRAILNYPRRYLDGVGRNLLLYAGLFPRESDSAAFRAALLSGAGSRIDAGPPGFPPLNEGFARKPGDSLTRTVLRAAAPLYDLLAFLGFLATMGALIVGLVRLDVRILAFSGIPLAFVLLHALILSSQDRMVVPVYPFFFVNLVMLPTWLSGMAKSPQLFPGADPAGGIADRFALRSLAIFIAILSCCHVIYALTSRTIPSADEAHYLSGVYQIAAGLHSGSLKMLFLSYASALGFKAPLICVPAALLSAVLHDVILSARISLVLIFVAIGFATYSLLRNLLRPFWAACGTALLITSPVLTGLTHTFYVESLLLLLLLIYVNLLIRFPLERLRTAILLGIVLGLGQLTKSLFAPEVAIPTFYAAWLSFRNVAQEEGSRRAACGIFLRLAVLGGLASLIAATWYGFGTNWASSASLAKAGIACAECDYPVVPSFLAWASSVTQFFVFVLAGIGLLHLGYRLWWKQVLTTERNAWVLIVLLGLISPLANIMMPNKSVRLLVPVLPALGALAVFAVVASVSSAKWSKWLLCIIVSFSFVLFLHNSFGVLPVASIRLGDLRILDSRFPLNPPDWFDDNHPVDRRDFRIADAARLFGADVLNRRGPGSTAQAGLLVHGLFINHDYLNLLAQQERQPVHYRPHYLTTLTAGQGPDYLLSCTGCGEVYPGRHYHDPHPTFLREVFAKRAPYEVLFELDAPAGCRLWGFRKISHLSEPIATPALKLLPGSTPNYVDGINSVPVPDRGPAAISRGRPLRITGWAVDAFNQGPAGGVYLQIGDKTFKADYGIARPDVATALGNPEYEKVGFVAELELSQMTTGTHLLTVLVLSSSGDGYYRGTMLPIEIR